ncbi:carboxylating nicotinate-nucleotide diphosphorylase [Chlorobaculum sp. 24CR]|uniref:carboxylating nicotinate-nucleotide diphosphorylase n=1 Tax=Chlorobaculum sp. 24CR TaxID=2508878 RepID=UPI00100B413A|nr:carboxylating nicotinate-nucleotide diphosphorylase [Chlorobaculum sp. 24CR]RXK89444.1 carboxylating nicotinate-nucleotide diphosphorylase [Chlorobaculum sp. 24CR]
MEEKRTNLAFREFFETCRLKAMQLALEEDRYLGDITTEATVEESQLGLGYVEVKAEGIIAGVEVARQAFQSLDSGLEFTASVKDGKRVYPGERILEVKGRIASILVGERTALNFMQRMSGIATRTNMYVERVSHTNASILDTRKTAPALRYYDKDAVRIGGGTNHRFGLFDMILIKDNHIDAAGSVEEAVRRAKAYCKERGVTVKIETEVRSISELVRACTSRPDMILLDNFMVDDLAEAVRWVKANGYGNILLEASGSVGLHNVSEIAMTGVDYISIGELTHSVKALDMSMKIERA